MPVTSSAISAGAGLLQTGIGLISHHNIQSKLDKLQNPQYTQSKEISDYYNEALNRYNTSPYNSIFYTQAEKNAQQGLAQGIGALTDRRSGVAGIGALVGQEQNQLGKAAGTAEAMRTQAFGALGKAAGMKAGEERQAFDINQMMPFERRYSELMGRLQGSNQLINAGLSNTFQGIAGQQTPFGQQGGIGGLFKSGSSSILTQNPYTSQGTGLADTGGASVANPVASPASLFGGNINPMTALTLAGG